MRTGINKSSLEYLGFERVKTDRVNHYYTKRDIVLKLYPLLNIVIVYRGSCERKENRIGKAETIEQLNDLV